MSSGTARATAIDDDAFSAFLQRSLPSVRRFVRRLCGNDADTDDVVQDTLAKTWRLRQSFDPDRNGTAWLQQAAFRQYCDHRRRSQRQREVTSDGAPSVADEAPRDDAPRDWIDKDRACRSELRDELRHRLAGLPEIERTLLLGFHRDGLTLRELAERHTLPINTVKSHLHRARRRLPGNAQ